MHACNVSFTRQVQTIRAYVYIRIQYEIPCGKYMYFRVIDTCMVICVHAYRGYNVHFALDLWHLISTVALKPHPRALSRGLSPSSCFMHDSTVYSIDEQDYQLMFDTSCSLVDSSIGLATMVS